MAGAVRGSCSGDIITSHFTRVLPSISPWININHFSIPHTQQALFAAVLNTDVRRGIKYCICSHLWTSVNDHTLVNPHLFLPMSFCPSSFMVQAAVEALIVPNHCWRSRLLNNTSSSDLSFSSFPFQPPPFPSFLSFPQQPPHCWKHWNQQPKRQKGVKMQ